LEARTVKGGRAAPFTQKLAPQVGLEPTTLRLTEVTLDYHCAH